MESVLVKKVRSCVGSNSRGEGHLTILGLLSQGQQLAEQKESWRGRGSANLHDALLD